jgi:NAD(P)-dependent dehydrogenase (short-subunit alcohol dehydrogenase family)
MKTKSAIITGACGGIGQALAKTFYDAGYFVVATDISQEPTKDLKCDHYLSVDLEQTVVDPVFAEEVFSSIKSQLPSNGLNVLINNAALQVVAKMELLTREDWSKTLNINLIAPFLWTQAFLPMLEASAGSVINISSIHAHLTKKEFSAYSTSKAALSGMTRSLAVELGSRVRINAIEPAAIETEMLKEGFSGELELYEQLGSAHPAGRIGQPEEVTKLALFLAQSDVGFVNGACIPLDGAIGSCLHDPNV